MKAEILRNPKISLHVPIAAPKLELWALNITGRIYLIAAVCDPKTGRKLLSQKYTLVGIETCKIAVCQMEEFHGLVFWA